MRSRWRNTPRCNARRSATGLRSLTGQEWNCSLLHLADPKQSLAMRECLVRELSLILGDHL